MTNLPSLDQTAAIVLAAGRGTRMKAKNKNKVAFVLDGKPMVRRTVDNLQKAGVKQIIAVVGFQSESVKQALGDLVTYVTQTEPKGTGDALRYAVPLLSPNIDTVLAVYGDDSAFYPPSLYIEMITKLKEDHSDLLFLTIHKDDPTGLGRIVRGDDGEVERIVEEKNASLEQKSIKEINTGFYCFTRSFLEENIRDIKQNPLTGEYYATDLVEIAKKHGKKVTAYYKQDGSIWHGVNNRSDFARAQKKAKHV